MGVGRQELAAGARVLKYIPFRERRPEERKLQVKEMDRAHGEMPTPSAQAIDLNASHHIMKFAEVVSRKGNATAAAMLHCGIYPTHAGRIGGHVNTPGDPYKKYPRDFVPMNHVRIFGGETT